ncbi:MAG: PAS domain S-box protein [Rhodothermaceae bacterium]|nr:PAS domain S-box protein [Rhodothermaceae bacterium]
MTHQTLNSIKEKVGAGGHKSLSAKFDIDNDNLSYRREFLRLGEEERALCVDMIPWMEEHAPKIAREFYDFQFTFSRTSAFFEHMAAEKGMSVVNLRTYLENAQQSYLVACFQGAKSNWDVNYFESRLKIGEVHHRINLPYKWYIGSYTEFTMLVHKYLKESFEDRDYVDRVMAVVTRIFNYDLQAVVEATIYSGLESFGFPFDSITTTRETDRGDHLDQINNYLVGKQLEAASFRGQLDAIANAQGVVELEMDGTVLAVNQIYLNALGYAREDAIGRNHSSLVGDKFANSSAYRELWRQLKQGNSQVGEYLEQSIDGRDVWFQVSYNPIMDDNGVPFKVVKYATDITEEKLKNLDYQGQIEAISDSQAVIEFNMNGEVLKANSNFLSAMGYSWNEIDGRHHRMFVEPEFAMTSDYRMLWERLNQGETQAGEFKRVTSRGNVIWLSASYTPLLDSDGKPFKVIKYAREITQEVEARERLEHCVTEILEVVNAAAQGDLTRELSVAGDDPIGQMGGALRGFFSKLKEIIGSIDENAQHLSAAADEMAALSDNMGESAGETSSQATTVASSAEEVSSNIQTVAAGAEEMSASIKEVATNAGEAARVAAEAVDAAEKTNITVTKLGESSAEIGNVIKVITSIAQQTNLLALNATIEAARAGEAGKGFAVVANEVKELAKQTAQATEEISQKIEAIQTDTKGAVDAISKIGSIIGQINDIQGTIAAAVEEQTSTTTEIARNVHEAAKGSSEIAENISHVAMAADNTSTGAKESKTATEELAKMSQSLRGIVAMFQY